MTARSLILASLLLLAPSACDQVQSLLGKDAAKPDDAKPGEAKADDAKAGEAKAGDADVADAKVADAKADPAAPAPAAAAAPGDVPPTEPAPAQAAAPAEQPCIVGHWEATEYLAQINRALRSDPQLRAMTYKSKSGTIGYVIEPAVDGKGTVKAKASALTYRYAGKVQGIAVNLVFSLDGEITASYELAEPSRIVVAEPSKNDMRVKARAEVEGFGKARDSSKVRHQFDGDFPYECTAETLKVWTDGRERDPLEFKRIG